MNFKKLEFIQETKAEDFDDYLALGFEESHLVSLVLQEQNKDVTFGEPEKFFISLNEALKHKAEKEFKEKEFDFKRLTFISLRLLCKDEVFYKEN